MAGATKGLNSPRARCVGSGGVRFPPPPSFTIMLGLPTSARDRAYRAALLARGAEHIDGLWHLHGIFDNANYPGQPVVMPKIWLYVYLVGIRDPNGFKLEVEFVEPTGQVTIGKGTLDMTFENRPTPYNIDIAVPVGGFQVAGKGNYDVRLMYNGKFLDVTTLPFV